MKKISFRRLLSGQKAGNLLLGILVLINLSIGLFTFKDYGQSYDEYDVRFYAEGSLEAYSDASYDYQPPYYHLNYYGPAFFMVASLITKFLQSIFPNIHTIDFWHLIYFITFQIGVIFLFFLAKRWFNQWVSLFVVILFSSQPLLWGHAFINPKDLPFMTFFLASIEIGLWMWDKIEEKDKIPLSQMQLSSLYKRIRESCSKMEIKQRRNLAVFGITWTLLCILLLLGTKIINNIISSIVIKAYDNPADILGRLFRVLAANFGSIPVTSYITKSQTWFSWGKIGFLLLGLVLMLWLLRKPFLRFLKLSPKQDLKNITLRTLKSFGFFPIILASFVLGLTTSVRVIGPLAGLVISIYGLVKYGRKAVNYIIPYVFFSFVFMFCSWPFLWDKPITKLFESITMMSNFMPWGGRVLFNGIEYKSTELPHSYLPVLFIIQFTEISLVFIVTGFTLLIINLIKNRFKGLFLIVFLCSLLPLSYFILGNSPLYDNFRQVLFLVPFIFLLSGLAVNFIFNKIHSRLFRVLIVFFALIPSIITISSLHPYEYIYYNSLIGGVGGAFRRFDLDYWFTSSREALEYLNGTAPQDSKISVLGESYLIIPYARQDLVVVNQKSDFSDYYDFVVLNSKYSMDLKIGAEEKVVYSVERDGAILSVVKAR